MKLRWLRTWKKVAVNPDRIGDTQTVWSYDLTLQYLEGEDWVDVPIEDANEPKDEIPNLVIEDDFFDMLSYTNDAGHGRI